MVVEIPMEDEIVTPGSSSGWTEERYEVEVLDSEEVEGHMVYLLQWKPTLEPAGLAGRTYGKYKPVKVSHEVYEIDGERKRRVWWEPTWEYEEALVESEDDEADLDKCSAGWLADAWTIRTTENHGVPYYFNKISGEWTYEPPDGTTFALAVGVSKEQRRVLRRVTREKKELRRRKG